MVDIEFQINVANEQDFTGFCDQYGSKIFIGDRLEFHYSNGAIWRADVIFVDGVVTILDYTGNKEEFFGYRRVEEIKPPDNWQRSHRFVDSKGWAIDVGHGEFGNWNYPRKSLPEIAGNFNSSDEFFEVKNKFVEKYNEGSHKKLYRPLPVTKIIEEIE